ncbi:hypothetical protein FSW04_12140 [Baekduia soli]|uniref:Uncharacterized protein n=1 Tax=Baekduia soli TaxID=496014 RepID=A0A5B8U5N0_9ACTN|nr:hypothetical protein [Baekduia soli]QEC48241.1 hypothetical protein FSW04_12140 [Baekduia soli]
MTTATSGAPRDANVAASLALKALLVMLAPLGLVTLVLGRAGDTGMSLLATLNAVRLLRAPPYAPSSSPPA